MSRAYFAVGTALYEEPSVEARVVARATSWLLRQRNKAAIWGGEDQLDRFISTNHAAMSLLAVGFPAKSRALSPALAFLANLDQDTQVSFFWRSATFLNLRDYEQVVRSDAEFLWNHRRRIGVHKDYPVPFFLLKLLRFADPRLALTFTERDVLQWILDEWTEDQCWYGRTSITSMALALIHDLDFPNKVRVMARSREFVESRFAAEPDGCGRFSDNFVDDCFTIFNLCERRVLEEPEFASLTMCVGQAVKRVVGQATEEGFWDSGPPFGGAIGRTIYPTAVAVRALMSFCVTCQEQFRSQVASLMLDSAADHSQSLHRSAVEVIWGEVQGPGLDDLCFVLMPFEKKLTEIYERYVKRAVSENSGLRCERADDINKPSVVMKDVWERINRARVIIADLTGHNANVFYELGLAHALGKLVILIVRKERGKRKLMPFDVSGVRAIVYDDSPSGYEKLAERIGEFMKELGVARDDGADPRILP